MLLNFLKFIFVVYALNKWKTTLPERVKITEGSEQFFILAAQKNTRKIRFSLFLSQDLRILLFRAFYLLLFLRGEMQFFLFAYLKHLSMTLF